MKDLKKSIYLLLAGLLSLGFVACSDDDEPEQKTEVKLAILDTDPKVTYVSEGSFELTVQLTGNEETPKAEDFSIVPCSDKSSGFHFKWDTTEKGDMIFNRAKSSFNITGIRAGEKADTYVLTVDYTTTGAMEAIYAKNQLAYNHKLSQDTFKYSYIGYGHKSVGVPLTTLKKGEVPVSLKINVASAYEKLGIDPKEVHGVEGRHYPFAGVYGNTILEQREWEKHDDIFIGIGQNGAGVPSITILGAPKFETGIIHFVQLVISLGKSEYAAIHVPVLITE